MVKPNVYFKTKLYLILMTVLIMSFHPIGTNFQAFSQQSTFTIGTGTTCEVQTGVDICVDTIIVHGTFIMNGTYCGMPIVISSSGEIPTEFKLHNCYPNPFNPITNIKFDLPKKTNVKLIVYDLIGREMMTLFDSELPPGCYKVVFDASYLSSGTYFYKIITDKNIDVKKMILIK